MCRTLAISICLLEKYFAKRSTNTIFTKSTGWKAKAPRSNQLWAPLKTEPKTNKAKSKIHEPTNKTTIEPLRRKNLQSTKLAKNKAIIEIINQIICLPNKPPPSAKEFMVKIPATDMKNKAPKSNQSKE